MMKLTNAITLTYTFPSTSISTAIVNLAVTILSILGVLKLYRRVANRKANKNLAALPPGPAPWPIVGNLPELLRCKPTFRWVHGFMKEMNTDIACIRQRSMKHINNVIWKYHNPIIDERIRQWKSGQRKDMDDILDVLITLKDPAGSPFLSDDEIRYQLVELMIASVDNPSNAIEWAMAEMMNQPELMKKAHEEIDRVVGKERLVQESDIEKLNYVKACAREAYRLHPLSPFNVPHMSIQDTTVAGYHIPKGSHALLSRYGLGRNPKVWVNPLKFDPERHTNHGDVSLLENDLRFISFSTGRRGCIAGMVGTYMTIMLLARLVQCFDWTPPPSGIDLSEAVDELLTPAMPITAFAKPRLPHHLYPTQN
ncbi:hypothetical protein Tsubulata_031953 [Turnera subulata]|uniref:Cytochrome P450 n=1 Tax=Turnera subulata TaxID=218843 RepID=A0A9Q0GEL4_9ROSI|nr:hypothetical protein Tsubulata_031953 [Turnera subulata]